MEILGIAFTTKDMVVLVVGTILGVLIGLLASLPVRAQNRALREQLGRLQEEVDVARADVAQSHQDLIRLGTRLGLFTPVEQPGTAELHNAVEGFLTGTSSGASGASGDQTIRPTLPPAPLRPPSGSE